MRSICSGKPEKVATGVLCKRDKPTLSSTREQKQRAGHKAAGFLALREIQAPEVAGLYAVPYLFT